MTDDARQHGGGDVPSSGAVRAQDRLAQQLSELALALQQEDDVPDTLDAIVRACVDTVPGAQHASLSVIERRREVHTRAATDDLPRQLDHAQYETGRGPCLSALYEQKTVRLGDMTAELRWPEFTRRALALGVGSMLAVQLFVVGEDLGALNLSNRRANAFDDESEHVALLLASHAAVAMAGAQERHRLRQAMSTREVIGQATGVLIERFKTTPEQAFLLLVRASQHSNRKLRDVADELVHVGTLPADR